MARGAAGLLTLLWCGAATAQQVSENPVRSDQVVISWPAATGSARVSVFSFTGQQVFTTTVAASSNEYAWDLMVGGRRVVNGVYIIVIDVEGHRYRRRLFVARPGGGGAP